jgi:phosphoserine phosphatase
LSRVGDRLSRLSRLGYALWNQRTCQTLTHSLRCRVGSRRSESVAVPAERAATEVAEEGWAVLVASAAPMAEVGEVGEMLAVWEAVATVTAHRLL